MRKNLYLTLSAMAALAATGLSASAAVPSVADASIQALQAPSKSVKMEPKRFAAPALAGDEKPFFITSVPQGAEASHYIRDWRGYWVFNYIFSAIMQGEETGRVQDLWFDGDDVYMKTPVLSFEAQTYLKGTKTETGISFPLPQCIYSYTDNSEAGMVRTDYYVDFLYFDPDFISWFTSDTAQAHSWDLTLQADGSYQWVNEETMDFVDNEGQTKKAIKRILGVVNQDEEWTGYADFKTLLKPFTDTTPTLPEGAKTSLMTYTTDSFSRRINVGFKDDKVYFQGLTEAYPEVWTEGTMSGNEVVIPRQYVGIFDEGFYYGYISGATSRYEWSDLYEKEMLVVEGSDEAVFKYDPATYTFTTDEDLYVGGDAEYSTVCELISNPKIVGQADSYVPHTPEILNWYNYNRDYGYGRVSFDIPAISETGVTLDPERLDWRLEIDYAPYVFDPSKHKKLTEPMEWIPYNFTDGDDIKVDGVNRYVYFRAPVEETLAVVLRYTAPDGEVFISLPAEVHTENWVPDPTYTVEPDPAQPITEIKTIAVKFDGVVEMNEGCSVNISEGITGNSELVPRMIYPNDEYNYRWVFCNDLYEVRDGNTLWLQREMTLDQDFFNGSEWVEITIYGGSYTVNGRPGKDIVLLYNFAEDNDVNYTVVPDPADPIGEIQTIAVKFDGAVEMNEGCSVNIDQGLTGNSELVPRMVYPNDEYNYRWVFCNKLYEVRDGNTLWLEREMPLDQAFFNGSEWVEITIYGGSYTVDGLPGEDITLLYTFGDSAVGSIFGEDTPLNVTDLSGRVLMRDARPGDLRGLKGIYIVNGRKVVF